MLTGEPSGSNWLTFTNAAYADGTLSDGINRAYVEINVYE